MENKKREFGINKSTCRVKEKELELHPLVEQSFLSKNSGSKEPEPQEFGGLDVHFVDENGKKIGVEVKPYFIIIGKEAEAAFGQALLRKKRNDVKEMFVAFPMSENNEDNGELIENFEERLGKIWENLGLLEEKGEIKNFSIKDINKCIYNKVYSSLGIGLLGIMGRVNENGKFQIEKVEEL